MNDQTKVHVFIECPKFRCKKQMDGRNYVQAEALSRLEHHFFRASSICFHYTGTRSKLIGIYLNRMLQQ